MDVHKTAGHCAPQRSKTGCMMVRTKRNTLFSSNKNSISIIASSSNIINESIGNNTVNGNVSSSPAMGNTPQEINNNISAAATSTSISKPQTIQNASLSASNLPLVANIHPQTAPFSTTQNSAGQSDSISVTVNIHNSSSIQQQQYQQQQVNNTIKDTADKTPSKSRWLLFPSLLFLTKPSHSDLGVQKSIGIHMERNETKGKWKEAFVIIDPKIGGIRFILTQQHPLRLTQASAAAAESSAASSSKKKTKAEKEAELKKKKQEKETKEKEYDQLMNNILALPGIDDPSFIVPFHFISKIEMIQNNLFFHDSKTSFLRLEICSSKEAISSFHHIDFHDTSESTTKDWAASIFQHLNLSYPAFLNPFLSVPARKVLYDAYEMGSAIRFHIDKKFVINPNFRNGFTCPGFHDPHWFVTSNVFTCDLCHIAIPANSEMLGCRICDFDICSRCVKKRMSKAQSLFQDIFPSDMTTSTNVTTPGSSGRGKKHIPTLRCKGKHMPQWMRTAKPRYTCNVCNEILPQNSHVFACRKCDWDACKQCVARIDRIRPDGSLIRPEDYDSPESIAAAADGLVKSTKIDIYYCPVPGCTYATVSEKELVAHLLMANEEFPNDLINPKSTFERNLLDEHRTFLFKIDNAITILCPVCHKQFLLSQWDTNGGSSFLSALSNHLPYYLEELLKHLSTSSSFAHRYYCTRRKYASRLENAPLGSKSRYPKVLLDDRWEPGDQIILSNPQYESQLPIAVITSRNSDGTFGVGFPDQNGLIVTKCLERDQLADVIAYHPDMVKSKDAQETGMSPTAEALSKLWKSGWTRMIDSQKNFRWLLVHPNVFHTEEELFTQKMEVGQTITRSRVDSMRGSIGGSDLNLLSRMTDEELKGLITSQKLQHKDCTTRTELEQRARIAKAHQGQRRQFSSGILSTVDHDKETTHESASGTTLNIASTTSAMNSLNYMNMVEKYQSFLSREALVGAIPQWTNAEDLARVRSLPFANKVVWFRAAVDEYCRSEKTTQIKLSLKPELILALCMDEFANLAQTPQGLQSYLRISLDRGAAIDEGGVVREMYELVVKQAFEVKEDKTSYFLYSETDRGTYQINPYLLSASGINIDDALKFYHFIGQFIGRALLDNRPISVHFTHPFYKYLVGDVVTIGDLEFADPQMFLQLNRMQRESVTDWGIYFSVEEPVVHIDGNASQSPKAERPPTTPKQKPNPPIPSTDNEEEKQAETSKGSAANEQEKPLLVEKDQETTATSSKPVSIKMQLKTRTVSLIENGADIEVNDHNKSEFVFRMSRYIMLDRVQQQMDAILHGVFQVIPPYLLSVFSASDLELLLCGVEVIDVKDWRRYTQYIGYTAESKVIAWFWEVVENDMSNEDRQRLLQYVTGTSRVPNGGFAKLSSQSGASRQFTIYKTTRDGFASPRAHTCFNQLDLPTYLSKEELSQALKYIYTSEASGFTQV